MSMVVTVNGVPQKGRLELKLTEAGNYSITNAVMTALEEPKPVAPGNLNALQGANSAKSGLAASAVSNKLSGDQGGAQENGGQAQGAGQKAEMPKP